MAVVSIKPDDELSPYLLEVEGLEEAAEREEKQALRGSYGYVFKVNVGGVARMAKKLHSAFIRESKVSLVERQAITSKFRNECIILSKLRHPNIVQFVGVHYGRRGKTDLTLIMESVRCDLDDFLSEHPDVPLSLKVSVLLDVSYGLIYLHEYNPPIVHRDLTARNILITDSCQAKIADLGVAKIVSLQQQLAPAHTQTPGQMFFMPPEALIKKAECTPKLDIFSFGHLALFTVIQEYPEVFTVTITVDIQRSGIIERLKRGNSLDLLGSDHCLYPIITKCLYDSPDQRPTTRDLNRQLIQLSSQHPVSMIKVMPLMGEDLPKDLSRLAEQNRVNQLKLEETNRKLLAVNEECDHLKLANAQLELEKEEQEKINQQKYDEISTNLSRLRDHATATLKSLRQECEQLKVANAQLELVIKQKEEQDEINQQEYHATAAFKSLNEECEQLKLANAQLESEIRQKEEQDEINQQKYDEMTRNMTDLSRTQEDTNAALKSLNQECEKLKLANAQLELEIKQKEEQDEINQQKYDEMATSMSDLLRLRDRATAALKSLSQECEQLKKVNAQLESEKAELKSELDELDENSGQDSIFQKEVKVLKEQLDEQHRESEKLSRDVQQTAGKLKLSEVRVHHLEQKDHTSELSSKLERQVVEIEELKRSKEDLMGELEAQKFTASTFREDFEAERKDREKAHSLMAEMKTQYARQFNKMGEELGSTQQRLAALQGQYIKLKAREKHGHVKGRRGSEGGETSEADKQRVNELMKEVEALQTNNALLQSQLDQLELKHDSNPPRLTNATSWTQEGMAPVRPIYSYNMGAISSAGGPAYSGGGMSQSGGGTNAATPSYPRPNYMSMGGSPDLSSLPGDHTSYQQAIPPISPLVKKTSWETPYQPSYTSRNSASRPGDLALTNASYSNEPGPTNATPRTQGGVSPMSPIHPYNMGAVSSADGPAYSGVGVFQSGGSTNAAPPSYLRPAYISMPGDHTSYQQATPPISPLVKKTSWETPYQPMYTSRNSANWPGDLALTNTSYSNAPHPANVTPRTQGGMSPVSPIHPYNMGVVSSAGAPAYSGGSVSQSGGGTNAAPPSYFRPGYMSMGSSHSSSLPRNFGSPKLSRGGRTDPHFRGGAYGQAEPHSHDDMDLRGRAETVENDSLPTSFLSLSLGPSHSSGGPTRSNGGFASSLNCRNIGSTPRQQQDTGNGWGSSLKHGQYHPTATVSTTFGGAKFGHGCDLRVTPFHEQPIQEVDPPTSGSSHAPFVNNDFSKAINTSVISTNVSSVEDNRLEEGLDKEIGSVADTVKMQVGGGAGPEEEEELPPYDPNLVCPTCGRRFRLGQIQVFRLHAAKCISTVI